MVNVVTAYVTNPVIAGVIAFVLGVLFSTKVKDFVTGVPSEFRSAMSAVEIKAKSDVAAATADVFAKLTPAAPAAPAKPAAGSTGATGA